MKKLWLAEFLLSLLMQEQREDLRNMQMGVVISWIFIIFADARTTRMLDVPGGIALWLAEFLLSLLMQEQPEVEAVTPKRSCD